MNQWRFEQMSRRIKEMGKQLWDQISYNQKTKKTTANYINQKQKKKNQFTDDGCYQGNPLNIFSWLHKIV